jgi:hypothetical protein
MDDDGETLPYLFPDGINDATASTKATLNLREIPVALQMFDWNAWLPRVHPMDAFFKGDFERAQAWSIYNGGELHDSAQRGPAAARGELLAFENAVTAFRRSLKEGMAPDLEYVTARSSLQLWQIVKVWEVMQTYHLEDDSPQLYGTYGEARSWFSQARNVFDAAPHIAGESNSPCCAPYGSELQNKVASHRWYHMQLLLNAGHRDIKSNTPDGRFSHLHRQALAR